MTINKKKYVIFLFLASLYDILITLFSMFYLKMGIHLERNNVVRLMLLNGFYHTLFVYELFVFIGLAFVYSKLIDINELMNNFILKTNLNRLEEEILLLLISLYEASLKFLPFVFILSGSTWLISYFFY